MAMAAAARRLVRASLVGSLASGDFAAARRFQAGGRNFCHLQRRLVYTESERMALARVRRLAEELNEAVGTFPSQALESHSIEMVKLRQQQKYYKSAVWVLVSLFAGVAIPGSFANLHLGNDVADLKLGLKAAQDEIFSAEEDVPGKFKCGANSCSGEQAVACSRVPAVNCFGQRRPEEDQCRVST